MNAVATRRQTTRWFGVSVLVAVIALGLTTAGLAWYEVAHALSTARPVKVPTIRPVSGVVWGGRVFQTKGSLATWLHDRGASYSTWADRHPALAHVLETH